jgi:hypothetical protein
MKKITQKRSWYQLVNLGIYIVSMIKICIYLKHWCDNPNMNVLGFWQSNISIQDVLYILNILW